MQQIKCGLEIHTYVKVSSNRKLFCNCKTLEAEPNTSICPICTAQPGAKPQRPLKEAVEKTISISLMFGCKINSTVLFQRKHYSWPDLPSGYQKTMSGSYAKAVGEDGSFLGIGIEGVHLEEDPAQWNPETGIVNYNRSGRPLVEIVTKPDFTSSEQVREWLHGLMAALRTLGAVDEDAGIKADVNVSIPPRFQRVEIKNIHSFKEIVDAIEYEAKRQEHELSEGKVLKQETRAWHAQTNRTVFMRDKETAQDYMFIPDPDLPTIRIPQSVIDSLTKSLPERPDAKAKRYIEDFGVDEHDARIIASDPDLSCAFEKVATQKNAALASKIFRTEILRILNKEKKSLPQTKLTAKNIIDVVELFRDGKISDRIVRKVLEHAAAHDTDVQKFVQESGLEQKEHDIDGICRAMLEQNPQVVADFKSGKEQAINFLVGRILKELKGTADAKSVREALIRNIP